MFIAFDLGTSCLCIRLCEIWRGTQYRHGQLMPGKSYTNVLEIATIKRWEEIGIQFYAINLKRGCDFKPGKERHTTRETEVIHVTFWKGCDSCLQGMPSLSTARTLCRHPPLTVHEGRRTAFAISPRCMWVNASTSSRGDSQLKTILWYSSLRVDGRLNER